MMLGLILFIIVLRDDFFELRPRILFWKIVQYVSLVKIFLFLFLEDFLFPRRIFFLFFTNSLGTVGIPSGSELEDTAGWAEGKPRSSEGKDLWSDKEAPKEDMVAGWDNTVMAFGRHSHFSSGRFAFSAP